MSSVDELTETNVLRHSYRELTIQEKTQIGAVKDIGQEFLTTLESIGSSRELSLAKTKVEEAVMWAVKHVTR